MRNKLDISAYFVVGPENTKGRPVAPIIRDAVDAGVTCVQIRSKTASARELIELTGQASGVIAQTGKSGIVALLVNDRLDVVLAAKKQGINVDGIHVGQSDIPVDVCREYLGPDAIVGLSATMSCSRTSKMQMSAWLTTLAQAPCIRQRPNRTADLIWTEKELQEALPILQRLLSSVQFPLWLAAASNLPISPRLPEQGLPAFLLYLRYLKRMIQGSKPQTW